MNTAIIFGRFCPLHNAHHTLILATIDLCHKIEFGVFTHKNDPISFETRKTWLERFGTVHEIPITDIKQAYAQIEVSQFSHIDLVAGSNPALIPVAKALKADHFMWDPAREAMPIKSHEVLKDVVKNWHNLPDFVRVHAQKRLSFVGPESVGKSFFAKRMAQIYGGPHVPEYGRPHEKYRDKIDYTGKELADLAHRHGAARAAIARVAGPVLFEDTEELMTAVWSEMLLESETKAVEKLITKPELYVLFGSDTPWEEDSLRYFAKKEMRQVFFDRIETKLKKHDLPYQIIDGDWDAREAETVEVVENLLNTPFKFR